MSVCLTWFYINGLVEPNLYHNLGEFTRMCGFHLEGAWLCRISGGGQSHNWVCDWPF